MPIHLTRRQSLWIGIGLLVTFFVTSIIVISKNAGNRIPSGTTAPQAAVTPTVSAASTQVVASTTPNASGFTLQEFHRSLVRDGRVLWEVFGKQGRYSAEQNLAEIDLPRLTVSRKEGENIKLSSKRAALTLAGTDLSRAELFDDVVVVYQDQGTLTTSHAIYDKTTNTVDVPTDVRIETEDATIVGHRLTADIEQQVVTISDGVTTTLKPRKPDDAPKG